MKTLRYWLLAMILASRLLGAEVTLVWDPNPVSDNVTSYQVRVDEVWGIYSSTTDTPKTSHTFTDLKRGTLYMFTVTATNSKGVSDPATLAHTVAYKVRLTYEKGNDLMGWAPYHTHEVEVSGPKEFFRAKVEYLP
jgi:hypothetical protein